MEEEQVVPDGSEESALDADEEQESSGGEESSTASPAEDELMMDTPITASSYDKEAEGAFQREVAHLNQRIRNNQSAIQTATTLANLSTYEINVLKAVQNSCMEWDAIVRHYAALTQNDPKHPLCKPTALAVFELAQKALQCGPLAGSKPGYFARCGRDVAQVVLDFLQAIPLETMLWTEKQQKAMETWKKNATKAIEKEKGPSKSVQTKMTKAANKSQAKKQHKQKRLAQKNLL